MATCEVIGVYTGPPTGAITITTTVDVAAGDAILVLGKQAGNWLGSGSGCSDTAGNSYTVGTGGQRFFKGNAAALPAGGVITVTTNVSFGDFSLSQDPFTHVALRLTGVASAFGEVTAVSVGASNPNVNGGQITIGSSPTTASGYLMVGWANEDGDASFAPFSPWTVVHNADKAVVAYREETTSGTYKWEGAASMTTGGGNGLSLWLRYLALAAPAGTVDVSQARAHNTGLLLASHINASGVIATNRYDSSLPPAVAATVTHETSQGSGVSLVALAGNSLELLYAHNGTIKRRITDDGGRTWSVATTIASGYQDVKHLIDPTTGLALAALWKESTNEWYLAIGQRPSGTGDHAYTVIGLLVGSAKRGASLTRTAGRRYEFAYRTTSDVLTIIRCKAKDASSVGTWS